MKKTITYLSLSILLILSTTNTLFAVIYSSVTSGNFNNPSTWSPSGIPTSGDEIIVSTSHTVTLVSNSFVKNITINTGGVLDNNVFDLKIAAPSVSNPIYENNGIHNGIGHLITYDNYTLELRGSGVVNCPIEISSYGLLLKNTCNLTINANIEHSVPGNFGMNNKTFIDNSQGGHITINGDIVTDINYFVGILNASGSITVNGNVYFQGGVPVGSGSNIENSDSLIITGNLYLAGSLGYFGNHANAITIIGGDLLGAGVGESFFFQEANAIVKFGGQVFPMTNDGDLITSGTGALGASEPNIVEYNGSINQIIKAPSDGAAIGGGHLLNTYSNLIINNTSNTGVNLPNTNIDVNDTLNLIDGIVNTGAYEIFEKNNSLSAIINHSTNSYINGNLRRNLLPTSGSYDFPVGNSTSYQLANVNLTGAHTVSNLLANFSNLSSGTGLTITEGANNFATILNCGGTAPGTGNTNDGVWTITPDAGTANYDLTLYGKNYNNSGTANTIVNRTNTSSPWVLLGTYVASTGSEPLVTTRNNFNGFSQFAIGVSNLTTSIADNSIISGINIYPIPASDIVNIDLSNVNAKNNTIELFDVLGNKIANAISVNNNYSINRNGLSSGVYFLKITLDEKVHSQKILFE